MTTITAGQTDHEADDEWEDGPLGGPEQHRLTKHEVYPRARTYLDAGLVGRHEILLLAGHDPRTEPAKAWWRKLLQTERLPLADGQPVDGRPTWRERTILWWLQDRTNHLSKNRPYLSAEDDRRATALAEQEPLAYQLYRADVSRRAEERKRRATGA